MAKKRNGFELKNRTSYTPIVGDGGFIYVNDNNEIVITYPFKAQNGYGNFIMSKGFSITKWDINTMKSIERHFDP